MKGQCEVCGKIFEGDDREVLIDLWSRHNKAVHKFELRSASTCCSLNFNESTFKTTEEWSDEELED